MTSLVSNQTISELFSSFSPFKKLLSDKTNFNDYQQLRLSALNISNYPFEEKQYTIDNNIAISYLFSDGAKDLTIVFLHGLGSAKSCFLGAFNFEELRSYKLLMPDLIGHGHSSAPKDFSYSMQEQAACLKQLLEYLPLSEDIVIVAHSMGGPIGIYLSQKLKNRVVGIIYAEGNLDVRDCFISKKIISEYDLESWQKSGYRKFLSEMEGQPAFVDFLSTFKKADPLVIYKSAEALVWSSSYDQLIYQLVELSVPTLAVFGEKNKGLYSSEKKLLEYFPVVYIPEASHNMMHENSAKFYDVIIDFLTQF
ncbi:MAG: alpha/beta hydrolase [Candidatus Heimdallarchaeota archaeon]|nr:alpha/beta hydrolase [Candidatus Heimdallarchaeota archaeon]